MGLGRDLEEERMLETRSVVPRSTSNALMDGPDAACPSPDTRTPFWWSLLVQTF
jgi:hypothetical protein